MKFLIVCVCALVATGVTAESKKEKRGLLHQTAFQLPTQTFLPAAAPLAAAPLPLTFNQFPAQLSLAAAQPQLHEHVNVAVPQPFAVEQPVAALSASAASHPAPAVQHVEFPASYAVERQVPVSQPVFVQQQPQAIAFAQPAQHVAVAQSQPITYAAQPALLAQPMLAAEHTFTAPSLATSFAAPAVVSHQVTSFASQPAFAASALAAPALAAPTFAVQSAPAVAAQTSFVAPAVASHQVASFASQPALATQQFAFKQW